MTPTTRWKAASALFAAIAGYALFIRGPSDDVVAETVGGGRDGAIPALYKRPLRVSAESVGISKQELIDQLLAAKSVKDVAVLADKLGMVGDDASIRAVKPLLADPRRGVPEAIVGAIGKIGTKQAIEVLVDRTHDDRSSVRYAAIMALGATQSREAESTLIELATEPGEMGQSTAIAALGLLGSAKGTETLIDLAGKPDVQIAVAATRALGSVESPDAKRALRRLIDSPDTQVASAALSAIDSVDSELAERLVRIVKAGDPQLIAVALQALGKAGEMAIPTLREAALHGHQNGRWIAVVSLGQIGGAKSIAALGEILDHGDRQAAMAAAATLANIGGPEARELLISSALSDRAQITGALAHLAQLEGEDVDAALLVVLEKGSMVAKRAALPRLLKAGNEKAMQVALEMARSGSRIDKAEAMRMLADSGSPKAWDALIEIAGKSRGTTRIMSLEVLSQRRPGDPVLEALLADSLFSGRRDESSFAANALGRIGTEQARQTLITALQGGDKQLAMAAAAALGQGSMTDSVKSALLAASRDNPALKNQVMHQLINAGAPEGMRLAEEVLNGKDASAASSVIYALAANGSSEAKRILERALDSREPAVRMAAIANLAQNPDERSTDLLMRLTRDSDPKVRATALTTLGQVGSEKAQAAILEAAQSNKSEDKIAAITGLASMDDPRAGQQLARLMRDQDPMVAQAAIGSAYNGGPEVDQTLIGLLNDPSTKDELRGVIAMQLRGRGTDLDDATEDKVTKLAGPRGAYGGYGYGGYDLH